MHIPFTYIIHVAVQIYKTKADQQWICQCSALRQSWLYKVRHCCFMINHACFYNEYK